MFKYIKRFFNFIGKCFKSCFKRPETVVDRCDPTYGVDLIKEQEDMFYARTPKKPAPQLVVVRQKPIEVKQSPTPVKVRNIWSEWHDNQLLKAKEAPSISTITANIQSQLDTEALNHILWRTRWTRGEISVDTWIDNMFDVIGRETRLNHKLQTINNMTCTPA